MWVDVLFEKVLAVVREFLRKAPVHNKDIVVYGTVQALNADGTADVLIAGDTLPATVPNKVDGLAVGDGVIILRPTSEGQFIGWKK